MKTLIALAAASFITTAAMAEDVPSPDGENYTFEVSYEGESFECNVHFLPHDDSAHTGLMMHDCHDAERSGGGSSGGGQTGDWISAGGSDLTISIELQSIIPSVIFNDCQQWQSVEVGETASDPCWVSSRSGEPIQVTRES